MAIRIREISGEMVALCAAKTIKQDGDVYLNDRHHHALYVKFATDFNLEEWPMVKDIPIDEIVQFLMLEAENEV